MKGTFYLEKLINHGYKAYIIGGYVRDKLLGHKTFDIDIATSATPLEVASIFNVACKEKYGSIYFKEEKYSIDITTFRKDFNYKNRYPEIKYVSTLLEDVVRRDFTINAIGMDIDGKLYDYVGGLDDIKNKVVRSIGDADIKFKEDPLRILRALRLSICYGLDIEEKTLNSIIKNKELLRSISYNRKRMELNKILISPNAKAGLAKLNELGILSLLEIKCLKEYKVVENVCSAWAQLEYSSNYPFTKKEKKYIENIKAIINKGEITNKDIFYYHKEVIEEAQCILGLSKEDIKTIYLEMPIHSWEDICITGREIKEILGSSKINIKIIKEDLIKNILSGNLSNEFSILKNYIVEKWK